MTAKSRSKNTGELFGSSWLAGALGGVAIVVVCAAGASGQTPAVAAGQPPAVASGPAQQPLQTAPATQSARPPSALATATPPIVVPPDYTIGPEDVLSIVFWRDKEMSSDVVVRPDGKISLPLLNDVQAAGLSPVQLRDQLMEEAKHYVEDSNVTVIVKTINSRRVFITGEIGRPGPYLLSAPTTILQLIATAGGLRDYAKADKIMIMRMENGKPVSHKFNYEDVIAGKKLQQNIELKPGDTIVVP